MIYFLKKHYERGYIMTIEEKLKETILNRYGSVVKFAEDAGLSNSTVATILTRGIHKASIDNILKICKTLGISADELAQDRIVPTYEKLHAADINDLLAIINSNVYIDEKKLNEDETKILLFAIEAAAEFIRRNRGMK